MSGFLYFLDSITQPVTAALLAQHELAYAFDAVPMHGVIDRATPSGNNGTLMTNEARQDGRTFAYRPDEQIWKKCPRRAFGATVYIGWWKDSPPTAASLIREQIFDGQLIELAQGGEWMIPRLRFWSGADGFRISLPSRAGIDEQGNWVIAGVETQFAKLDALADRLYEGMVLALLGQAQSLSTAEALDAVVTLLNVNYAVSKYELGFLEALPIDSRLSAACRAAIDYDRAEDWIQKKTLDSNPAAAGG